MNVILPVLITIITSFVFTVLVEMAVALLMKVQHGELSTVLLVNLVTNPPYVLLVLMARYIMAKGQLIFLQVVCEALIFAAEGLLYKKYMKDYPHPYLLSITANGASLVLGILVSHLMA